MLALAGFVCAVEEDSGFRDVADTAAAALSGGVDVVASVPRGCVEGERVISGNWAVGIPLLVPGLLPPGRRMAVEAPRLMRRLPKVLIGAVREV